MTIRKGGFILSDNKGDHMKPKLTHSDIYFKKSLEICKKIETLIKTDSNYSKEKIMTMLGYYPTMDLNRIDFTLKNITKIEAYFGYEFLTVV